MKVALVQCPAWVTTSPPYALALLGGALKKEGHDVRCFDLNIELYNAILNEKNTRIGIDAGSWSNYRIENDFANHEFIVELFHKCSIVDDFIEAITAYDPLTICFSVHSTSAEFSFELTRRVKKSFPGKVILWGGPYCFVSYNNIEHIRRNKPEIDVVCSGDGENNLPAILTHYEQKGFFIPVKGYFFRSLDSGAININNEAIVSDIDNIPFSELSFFKPENYSWKSFPIIVSRGCVNRCAFCNEWTCWQKYQYRSPARVVEEIKYQLQNNPQIGTIWLSCSNISGNITALSALCDLMIREIPDVSWDTQLAIRKELTFDLLSKMKQAGCHYLHYGLESGSNKVLKLMNKGYNLKLASRVLNDAARANINFNFNIVVGFPGETTYNFLETLFFIKRFSRYGINASVATCNISINSAIYNNYENYGVLAHTSENWKTKDLRNTMSIRKLRMHFTRQLYNLKILNFFNLSYLFFRTGKALPLVLPRVGKTHNLFSGISNIISLFIHALSYITFSFWIIFVLITLWVAETFSRVKGMMNARDSSQKNALADEDSQNLNTKIIDDLRIKISAHIGKDKTINPEEAGILLDKFNNIMQHFQSNGNFFQLLLMMKDLSVDEVMKELAGRSQEAMIDEISSQLEKMNTNKHPS